MLRFTQVHPAIALSFGFTLACGGPSAQAPSASNEADEVIVLDDDPLRDEPAVNVGNGEAVSAAPTPTMADITAAGSPAGRPGTGRLAREKINRVLHGSYASFRKCYASGLESNPKLAGRVFVKFVVDTDGGVSAAEDHGSTIPDPRVVQCVIAQVRTLHFPKPDGASVKVAYPIVFGRSD